jgi:hypothetical protein
MGSCDSNGGCKAAQGCSSRKQDQAELIGRAVERLYPTRRWSEIDDVARFRAGVPPAVAKQLSRVAAEVLQARTYFREGDEDDLCDYVYVLCVGREPSLLEWREGTQAESVEEGRIQESYLRLALSSVVRAGTIQEVQLHRRRRGDVYELREVTRDGVYDPVLLPRMRKLVDLVVQARITHLDFGMLCEDAPREPVIDFTGYEERYGVPPTTVALLFYPRPPIATTTTLFAA